jgi:hypothetical protein
LNIHSRHHRPFFFFFFFLGNFSKKKKKNLEYNGIFWPKYIHSSLFSKQLWSELMTIVLLHVANMNNVFGTYFSFCYCCEWKKCKVFKHYFVILTAFQKKNSLSDAWIIAKKKYSIFITRIIQSLANLRIQYSPLTWKYTTQICWLVLVPEH